MLGVEWHPESDATGRRRLRLAACAASRSARRDVVAGDSSSTCISSRSAAPAWARSPGCCTRAALRVTGSDRALYPPMSDALERWGIPVALGFDAKNVLSPRPDLVVIGNAVRADNPEAQAVFDAGIPYRSFPDALYELAMAGRHSVVVAGTHGKTTTTSLLGALLRRDRPRSVGAGRRRRARLRRPVPRGPAARTSSSRATSTTPPSSTRRRSSGTTTRRRCCSAPSSSTTPTSTATSTT